jgi:hypothetical protein
LHIVPGIGGVRLQALGVGQLNAFYRDLKLAGSRRAPAG